MTNICVRNSVNNNLIIAGRDLTMGKRAPVMPTRPTNEPSIFVSYAWDDDKPFVERLAGDLQQANITVRRDEDNLPSRGPGLPHELRHALDSAWRFVPVIGPVAAQKGASPDSNLYLEWEYARRSCMPVTVILRRGDPSLIPPIWSGLLYFDFRNDNRYSKTLAALIRHLRRAADRPGPIHGPIKDVPPWALRRPEAYRQIEQIVRPGHLTGHAAVTILHAPPGIGKSTLAALFASDCTTRCAFPDGIFWLKLGKTPSLAALCALVGAALGDDTTHKGYHKATRRP